MLVDFKEVGVEQKLDPLAGRHLALFVLPLAPLRPTSFLGQLITSLQLGNLLFQFHGRRL